MMGSKKWTRGIRPAVRLILLLLTAFLWSCQPNPPELTGEPTGTIAGWITTPTSHGIIALQDVSTGELTRLTPENMFCRHPIWSPDGARLVFWCVLDETNQSDLSLYTIQRDGHQFSRLVSQSELDVNISPPLAWSLDGTYILLYGTQKQAPRARNLYAIDVESGAVTQFLEDTSPRALTWSSDGTSLLLDEGHKVSVLNVETREVSVLREWAYNPEWFPKSEKIVREVRGIGTITLNYWNDRQVQMLRVTENLQCLDDLAWSADKQYILFTAGCYTGKPAVPNLYVMDANTGEYHQITHRKRLDDGPLLREPVWAPIEAPSNTP